MRHDAERLGDRQPAVVFALEHDAGRRALRARRSRQAARQGGACASKSRGCSPTRARSASRDSFASQWLQLRKVGMFPPDKKLYPDYDKHLEASMIGETTRVLPRGADRAASRCASSSTPTGRWSTRGSRSTTACRRRVAGRRLPARRAHAREPSRRPADAGGDPVADVRRHAASPGASRQVGLGVDLRQVAAAAAGERRADRAEPRRPRRRRRCA